MRLWTSQGDVVPKATKSQLNEETQELSRLFRQKKETFPIRGYNDLTDESVKLVLGALAEY